METIFDVALAILLFAIVIFFIITWFFGMEPQILGAIRRMGEPKPHTKMQLFTFTEYVRESVAHLKAGWFGRFIIILAFPGAWVGRYIHNAMV